MNSGEANYTAEEQASLDRVIDTFGRDNVIVGDFQPKTVFEEADEVLEEDAQEDPVPGLHLVPVDLVKLGADGVPEPDYLSFPYLPSAARVWVFGPAESSKTMWAQWMTAKLSAEGRKVVFVSQENPLATDLDRMLRLRPSFANLTYFHMPGLDLANPDHLTELAGACLNHDLLVLDTLSACWSGDEASNADVVKLDRDVLAQLVRLTGITVLVIHHTGHPQAFVNRGGAGAGRGASAMGQKADVVLVFQPTGLREFTIDHGKNRTPGGYKEPKAKFRIMDTEDGGLYIERIGKAIEERVVECMDAAVELVQSADGGLGTNALRAALAEGGFGGATWTAAVAELRTEDPPRVTQVDGVVIGADGKHRKGKPWTIA